MIQLGKYRLLDTATFPGIEEPLHEGDIILVMRLNDLQQKCVLMFPNADMRRVSYQFFESLDLRWEGV